MGSQEKRADQVEVRVLPPCDFEHGVGAEKPKAKYDGKTRFGPWAFMCEDHYVQNGIGLGLGLGQRLVVVE